MAKKEGLTEEQKKIFFESMEWIFWDVKESLNLCNRLLRMANDTKMEHDDKDKEALGIIVELQSCLIECLD